MNGYYALERLAPALANDGPNPEYPWPRRDPQHTPIEYDFEVWKHLQLVGHPLWIMIDTILANFEQWF